MDDISQDQPTRPNTDIKSVINKDIHHEIDSNDSDIILNLSLSLNIRLDAIKRTIASDINSLFELLTKLSGMYELAPIASIEEYLYQICIVSEIPWDYKLILADALCREMSPKGESIMVQLINNTHELLDNKVYTPVKVSIILKLLSNEKYYIQALIYLMDIINNQTISCEYRYRVLLGLENLTHLNRLVFFQTECFLSFFNNDDNPMTYRILSSQYILQFLKSSLTREKITHIENSLLLLAQTSIDPFIQADAADVLLRYGSTNVIKYARELINKLGNTDKTVYSNAQNVHVSGIEKSIEENIRRLLDMNITVTTSFDKIKEQILSSQNFLSKENIIASLTRIELDRALYSHLSLTLLKILELIWAYIQTHTYKTTLIQRLLEELNEMANTCSTGYVSRLINTLSGFDNFHVGISWNDQIISNFTALLNKHIQNIPNEWNTEKRLQLVVSTLINIIPSEIILNFDHIFTVLHAYGFWYRDLEWRKYSIYLSRMNEENMDHVVSITPINPIKTHPLFDNNVYDTLTSIMSVKVIDLILTLPLEKFKDFLETCKQTDKDTYELTHKTTLSHLKKYMVYLSREHISLFISLFNTEKALELFQEKVLEDMTVKNMHDRPCFLLLFAEVMLGIRNKLYQEFKGYIQDQDFDTYTHNASILYISGEKAV